MRLPTCFGHLIDTGNGKSQPASPDMPIYDTTMLLATASPTRHTHMKVTLGFISMACSFGVTHRRLALPFIPFPSPFQYCRRFT